MTNEEMQNGCSLISEQSTMPDQAKIASSPLQGLLLSPSSPSPSRRKRQRLLSKSLRSSALRNKSLLLSSLQEDAEVEASSSQDEESQHLLDTTELTLQEVMMSALADRQGRCPLSLSNILSSSNSSRLSSYLQHSSGHFTSLSDIEDLSELCNTESCWSSDEDDEGDPSAAVAVSHTQEDGEIFQLPGDDGDLSSESSARSFEPGEEKKTEYASQSWFSWYVAMCSPFPVDIPTSHLSLGPNF